MRLVFAFLIAVSVAATGAVHAVAQQAEGQAHIDAYLKALSSGSPEQFEAMAREHFAPALLSRPADGRQRMVERVHADFGALTIVNEKAPAPGRVEVTAKGSTNDQPMRLVFELETEAPYKITQVGIQVGGPAGGGRGGRGEPPPLPAPPINGRMNGAEIAGALDRYVAGLASAGDFAGVVLVAKDGQPIFHNAYGPADRTRNTPLTPGLRFNVGSIGKAFTKTAIGQLIAAGTLSESDTIATLLPDYPNADARSATVGQLLTHRGGIADFFGDRFASTPKSRFQSNHDYYEFVAPQPVTFAPGARTQYCNGCYVVLGEIIARVSGMPYERYIQERVFAPAGMKDAGFLAYGDPNVAIGYTRENSSSPWRTNEAMHGHHGSAAGGLYATASDLLAFDNALREHRLLDTKMTGWFFEGPAEPGRAREAWGIAGGAPGVNADVESNGEWTVIAIGNLDPPNAVRLATTIAQGLFGPA